MQRKSEKATEHVRVYPSLRRRLKVEAAKRGVTIAEFIRSLIS